MARTMRLVGTRDGHSEGVERGDSEPSLKRGDMRIEETIAELNRRLHAVFQYGEGRFPEVQLEDMRELVDVGEPVIALENFCSQLYEYDVLVPRSARAELQSLCELLNLESSCWKDIGTSD